MVKKCHFCAKKLFIRIFLGKFAVKIVQNNKNINYVKQIFSWI